MAEKRKVHKPSLTIAVPPRSRSLKPIFQVEPEALKKVPKPEKAHKAGGPPPPLLLLPPDMPPQRKRVRSAPGPFSSVKIEISSPPPKFVSNDCAPEVCIEVPIPEDESPETSDGLTATLFTEEAQTPQLNEVPLLLPIKALVREKIRPSSMPHGLYRPLRRENAVAAY